MAERPSNGPVHWLLKKIRKLIPGKPQDRNQLINVLRDAENVNLMDADTLSMVEGVLETTEMQVRDIMIPRSHMVVIERDASLDDILPIIVEYGHSRFPVIGDGRDEVVGAVFAKSLLPYFIEGKRDEFNIREIMRPPVFIPESKRLNVLLKEFRSSRNHIAIVVDEYGGVAGLVTIEDVLEQIVGDIEGEHGLEDDKFIMQFNENEFTVKALTTIEEFNEKFTTDISDEEFDTIGGFVMHTLGHLPRRGETFDVADLRFRILRADKRRVHLLHLTRIDSSGPSSGSIEGTPEEIKAQQDMAAGQDS
ncbi:MAG: HlyC/CorC family transporter [Gammaproteobacteria bacterium]|nr:MAG: HlyC/CorC family transporter [Gammaproteobacteria bacterium]